MDDFFKPWRRTIGAVTLVVASMFMGGWVRSLTAFDLLNWRTNDKSIYFVFSNRGRLSWEGLQETHPAQITLSSFYLTGDATSHDFLENVQVVKWHWKSCGFEFGETTLRITGWRKAFRVIPYWSIVLPLTLLSAYLE